MFRDGHCALDCVVLDISTGGAQLQLADWVGVPDRFELRLQHGPRYQARVCHRTMNRAHVSFVDGLPD